MFRGLMDNINSETVKTVLLQILLKIPVVPVSAYIILLKIPVAPVSAILILYFLDMLCWNFYHDKLILSG